MENKIQLQKKDKLIFLGDYIDRGPKSKEVIDYIIELQNNDYDVVTLLGNHESMLIDAYNNNGSMSKWIQNGGAETLKSFEFDSLTNIDSKYLNFFNNLRFYFEYDEYLFVHAGFNDTIENPFTDKYSMLWKSRERYFNPILSDRIIIHGHAPISIKTCEEQIKNNCKVINIDAGCVYSNTHLGKLVTLEIKSRTILFVE